MQTALKPSCRMHLLRAAWLSLVILSAHTLAVEPVKICFVDDRSGAAADTGNWSYEGLRLAVDEINTAGGIGGRQLQVVAYDGKTDAQLSATYAARCAEDDKALLLVGGNPAEAAAAMIPVATEFGLPYYIMSAGTDKLADPPFKYHFRFGPENRQEADAVAKMISSRGFKRVAIIVSSVPSRLDGARATADALAKQHVQVVRQQVYDVNTTDLTPQVMNIKDAQPDVIFISTYPADGARILRAIRQLNIQAPVISARTALLDAMRQLSGASSNGVLVPNTVDPDRQDVRSFFSKLNSRFGPHQPTLYPVIGYDAAKLAAKVIAQPEVLRALDGGSIKEARRAFRNATEQVGKYSGLQGQEGQTYQFGPDRHQGPANDRWFTFISIGNNGMTLTKFKQDAN